MEMHNIANQVWCVTRHFLCYISDVMDCVWLAMTNQETLNFTALLEANPSFCR